MKCFISIGKVDKSIFFPIAGGVLNFFLKMLTTETSIKEYPLMQTFSCFLGMFLSLFLFIIYKIKNKEFFSKKAHQAPKSKLMIQLEYNDRLEEIQYHKYLYIIISGLLAFIFIFLTYKYIIEVRVNFWIFNIFFIYIFSFFFFKIKLYRHQFLCMIIFIVLGIIFDIYIGVHDEYINFNRNNIGLISLKLIIEIIFSLMMVINKYIVEIKYTSVYEISFYQGTIGLVITIIFLIIMPNDFKEYWKDIDIREVFSFLAIVILNLIYNIFLLITMRDYSTFHILISIIISEMQPFIEDVKKIGWDFLIIFIVFNIILFLLLIFIEVFELNFCGLQNNTKKNIQKRALLEEKNIKQNDDNDNDNIFENDDEDLNNNE